MYRRIIKKNFIRGNNKEGGPKEKPIAFSTKRRRKREKKVLYTRLFHLSVGTRSITVICEQHASAWRERALVKKLLSNREREGKMLGSTEHSRKEEVQPRTTNWEET